MPQEVIPVVHVADRLGAAIEQAPWGREIEVRDPDGNRLRIGEPVDD